jgi:single stranded DNA-binding protein
MNLDFTTLTFVGRLVEDPENSLIENSGTPMCKFTVASNKRISKTNEKTAYIPVTVFGREATICGEYLSKGREVRVTGELETNSYTDKNNILRKGFSCVVGLNGTVQFGKGGRRFEVDTADTPETVSGELTPEQRESVENLLNKGQSNH